MSSKSSATQTPIETYLTERLLKIGLTPEKNTRLVEFEGRPQQVPILRANEKEDCISIPYVRPDGEVDVYEDGKKWLPFERKRFRVPQEYKDKEGKTKTRRYDQPRKSGVFSYVPPAMVDKYRADAEIKTLIITEGEIKALAGSVVGLDILGIGGIHNLKDKETNTIEENIRLIIERCKVQNVVYLVDADLFAMAYKENENLTQRLSSFHTAVVNFREMLKAYDVDVYFAHIKPDLVSVAKGLDDLLELQTTDAKKVVDELQSLTTGNKIYFEIQKLGGGYATKLEKYFLLNSVADFYERYKNVIQDREFRYKGSKFYFDGTKVIPSFYNEAKQYLRIGCDFYKKIWIVNPHKEVKHQKPVMQLKPWSIGEINRDFTDNKKFISYIPKFDQFTNLPDNTGGYQRIIEFEHEGIVTRSYNRFNQSTIEPRPGEWKKIEMFLKHIFSSSNTAGENLYEFGLDWIQLAYFAPKQRLPILCPVSSERNTGKSTFLVFLSLIFDQNMAILDNERFTGKFTSHFVDKLIVALDEGFIPVEQKLMKERIKNYSTGRTVWLEGKGKDANEIFNFMHLIMCSNDESNFMQIDEGENRFCVLKVPVLTRDEPKLIDDLEKEVPAFIHYLSTRKLRYAANESRFHFRPSIYETAALRAVMERTEKKLHKEIKEYLREKFMQTKQQTLYYTPKDFSEEYNLVNSGFRINKSDFADYVKYELKKQPEPFMRFSLYRMELQPYSNTYEPTAQPSKPGTPYAFHISEYLTDKEIESLKKDEK